MTLSPQEKDKLTEIMNDKYASGPFSGMITNLGHEAMLRLSAKGVEITPEVRDKIMEEAESYAAQQKIRLDAYKNE